MIVGQNSLLNQYVPTFYIKDLRDGQTLIFDSVRRAFVNAEGSGTGGADRLGDLLDVSGTVDDPLSLANGQVLTYNSTTNLWENKLIDINDLLPDQTGNAGKVLSTNGSTLEWVTPTTGSGTVTSVSATGNQGVTALVINSSTTPEIEIGLGNITPTSVAATGTVTGSNLSGTNTGDQTITLTGDVTGSGTGTFATTLATVNLTPGVYGDAHFVPTVTVNAKGLVTSVTTQHVDTSVRDLIIQDDVLVIAPRHQYIVTSVLEVEGYIINNGVIAIL